MTCGDRSSHYFKGAIRKTLKTDILLIETNTGAGSLNVAVGQPQTLADLPQPETSAHLNLRIERCSRVGKAKSSLLATIEIGG